MGTSASAIRPEKNENRAETAKASRDIDKELAREKAESANQFKILLLGGSECGKTTIFKQMRILHLNGFDKEDCESFRAYIHANAVQSLLQLLAACTKFRLAHETEVQEDVARFQEYTRRVESDEEQTIPVVIGRAMERIWKSKSVQTAYSHRFSFTLHDSAKYFLDNIVRVTETIYMPSEQDILHCRFRTTGINQLSFQHKKMNFKMVDVGGQRTERRKWIHCFDNVDMILFVVSMADFDQMDPEDTKLNRLMQNYEIFRTIVRSDFFRNASIVLFLNKYDIFCEKLNQGAQLQACFRNYKGDNTPDDASAYVQKQFRRCVTEKTKYFVFLTTATDTNNIEHVFGSAVAHIVNENLKSTGLHE